MRQQRMLLKYLDLTQRARARAILDYLDGWSETHDGKGSDTLTIDTVIEILVDNNKTWMYTVDGEYMGDTNA